MTTGWRSAGLALITLFVGAALGAIAVFFVADPSEPPSLPVAQSSGTVPVVTQPFADQQPVTLVFHRSPDSTIAAPIVGVVTRSTCLAGGTMTSGQSGYSIDGTAIVSLHTDTPLFRDLVVGDHGADVTGVQAELKRLGLAVSTGQVFTQLDLGSIRQLIAALGDQTQGDRMQLSDFVWMPAARVSVRKCDIALGQRVQAGEVLASVGTTPAMSTPSMPAGSLAGQRNLQLDDISFELSGSSPSVTTHQIEALANTQTYVKAASATTSDTVTVTASVELVTPVSVVPLPPTAVAATSSQAGCVKSGNKTYAVRLVGSSAGSTLVVLSDTDRPSTISLQKPSRCM